jgi:hypothetical protein
MSAVRVFWSLVSFSEAAGEMMVAIAPLLMDAEI